MGDEIIDGILRHYSKRHIQVRKDFFDICAYDKAQFNDKVSRNNKRVRDEPNQECMAKILRIIESLSDNKKQDWYLNTVHASKQGLTVPKEPKEYRVTLSYSVICELLYNTYGESTVRKSVAELIHRNFLICYQVKKNAIPEYVINVPVVQAALKKLAEDSMIMPETEVSNLTPDSIEGEEGYFEVSNVTPEVSNLTGKSSNLTGKSSNLTPNKISERNEYTKEEEKITAQSPNGSVLPSFPSPVSTHKEGRPRPTEQPPIPEQPKPKSTRKPDVDPAEIQRVMDAVDKAMGAKMIWSDSRIKKGAKDLVEMGATDEQIKIVISSLKQSWYKDKITMTLIKEQWPARISQANLTIPPTDPSTQEDTPSRYEDPNFDPRMLSNTESIEYKSWLAAHEPQPKVLEPVH